MNQTHSICPTKMRKKSGSAFFTKLVWLNEVGPTIKPKGFLLPSNMAMHFKKRWSIFDYEPVNQKTALEHKHDRLVLL